MSPRLAPPLALVLLLAAGCRSRTYDDADDARAADAYRGDGGVAPDSGSPDAWADAGRDAAVGACSRLRIGATCEGGCSPELECMNEQGITRQSVNLGGGPGPALEGTLRVGGLCTADCTRDSDCGDPCLACEDGFVLGSVRVRDRLTCRARCMPTLADPRGGCRADQACDLRTLTCVDACTSDLQCRFELRDLDGDLELDDLVYLGDDAPGRCDPSTGRCDFAGDDSARAGDSCQSASDCADNGTCLRSGPDGQFPDGYCTRLHCGPANPCASEETCGTGIPSWTVTEAAACLRACQLGGETDDSQRLGPTGGHPDCGVGQTCHHAGAGAPNDRGICFPGEYNALPQPNLGDACTANSQCFSPFGRGACLELASVLTPVCSVVGCTASGGIVRLHPGVDVPAPWADRLCDLGAGHRCAIIDRLEDGTEITACIRGCGSATDCADGYACANSLCLPHCASDTDCRPGELCLDDQGLVCAMSRRCTCQR